MSRNAEFTQPDCRLSQDGQVASFPIDHNTPSVRGERDRAGSTHTCLRRIAGGRKLGLFSCSIPPSIVLSHNMSMTNTMSNWLCSGAFHSPPVPSPFSIRWPLVTILSPLAPRLSGSAADAARRARYGIPHTAGVNMLRHATFSGFGRNLARLVFGINYCNVWTYDYFYVDSRSTQL